MHTYTQRMHTYMNMYIASTEPLMPQTCCLNTSDVFEIELMLGTPELLDSHQSVVKPQWSNLGSLRPVSFPKIVRFHSSLA